MKGLKKDFGSYSGTQGAAGASLPALDPITSQHDNITIGSYILPPGSPSSNACLTFPQYLLFLNPELIMILLFNISH